jgi:hypothetical protein
MIRNVLAAGIVILAATALHAQRIEVSANAGYTGSEGLDTSPLSAAGQILTHVNPTGGGAWHVTAGLFANENLEIEFLWSRQRSQLEAVGEATSLILTTMSVDNYHGSLVYNFNTRDRRLRPFLFAGFGATSYDPGDIAGRHVEGESTFSSTWGGGLKFYFVDAVGAKITGRWTPTYINSTTGLWCDESLYCWTVEEPNYSQQFELTGGVTMRF